MWVAGNDAIVVTVSGGAGSATCKATDASGKLDVPRVVIDRVRVRGDGAETSSSMLTLSVSRVRTETRKDKKAKGLGAQPVGWLDLTTSSTESTSFEGCAGGAAVCGEGCADLKTDPLNCGACGTKCGASACVNGKCGATPACVQGPENTLAKCSDGCSNDGDSYIDCNDYCCTVRTDCPPTTACGKP